MTISSLVGSISYSGNASTTAFSFPYPFIADADLEVILAVDATGVETTQTITTHYTVVGAGDPSGGTVTMVTAPAVGETLLIQRIPALSQGLDLVENDPFPSALVEEALDKGIMIDQVHDERYNRTVHVKRTDTYNGGEPHLPIQATRATKVLAFDANGDFVASTTTLAGLETGATDAAASAAAALVSETNAAADVVSTNADVVSTNADVVSTNADVVSTNADVVLADAAASAAAIAWNFDNSTTMADPGSADLRLDNATIASATNIAVSANTGETGNPDMSAFIATWDDSTNTTLRGTIVIRKDGTPATFAVFSVSGVIVDNATWLQIPVAYVDGAGTLTNADALHIQFIRSGDKGQAGIGDMLAANNLSDVVSAATSRTNLGLGTAAVKNTGTANGDVVLLDATGLPAVDGSQLTGIASGATTAEKANIALNAFRISVNGALTVQNMVDGVVDEYTDETGVDAVASLNEIYDAVGDFYTNTASATQGTWTDTVAAERDINTTVGIGGIRFTASINGTLSNIQVDVGTIVLTGTQTAKLYSDNAGSPQTLLGTSTALALSTTGAHTFTFSAPPSVTASTIYWVIIDPGTSAVGKFVTTNDGGTHVSSRNFTITSMVVTDGSPAVGENYRIEINLVQPPASSSLQSNAFTALAQPTSVFGVLWEEDVDAVTLNSDLKFWASRDGGTTWAQGTLTKAATLSAGQILTATADVSAQPAGTSMKYKIETLNAKELKIHGASLNWS